MKALGKVIFSIYNSYRKHSLILLEFLSKKVDGRHSGVEALFSKAMFFLPGILIFFDSLTIPVRKTPPRPYSTSILLDFFPEKVDGSSIPSN